MDRKEEKRRQYADGILDFLGIVRSTQFIVVLGIQPKVCQSIQIVKRQHKYWGKNYYSHKCLVYDFKRLWICLKQMKWFISVICVDANVQDGKANGIHRLECVCIEWKLSTILSS